MMQHIHNTSRKLVNELKMPCSKVKHFHIFTFAAAVVLYPLSIKNYLLGTTNSLNLCYCPLVTIRINTHPFLPSTHQFFYLSLLVLLILKARLWPQVTRRSQFFHRNIKLSTLDFTGSRHWAPFQFSQSTPLSKCPGTGFLVFCVWAK